MHLQVKTYFIAKVLLLNLERITCKKIEMYALWISASNSILMGNTYTFLTPPGKQAVPQSYY